MVVKEIIQDNFLQPGRENDIEIGTYEQNLSAEGKNTLQDYPYRQSTGIFIIY